MVESIEVREAYEGRSGLVSESILVDALYQDNRAASQQFLPIQGSFMPPDVWFGAAADGGAITGARAGGCSDAL